MGRFLLGIVCAAALWFGYQAWFAPDSSAGGRGTTPEGGAVGGEGLRPVDEVLRSKTDPDAGPGTPGPGAAAGSAGDEGGSAGGSAGDGASWRGLLEQTGAARSRSAAELVAAANGLEGADLVQHLGRSNDFLHSSEGREVAGRLLQRLDDHPANEGLALVSSLFELCAVGRIRKEDTAARAFVDDVRHAHRGLARRTVLDPANIEAAKVYDVQPGDTLSGIASKLRRELGIPVEHGTLQVVNRIDNPQSLRAGQRLKVPMKPVRARVFKRSYLVAVYVGEHLARTYWCAHGREQRETPETTFVVREKISEPDWHPGGRVVPYGHEENPLGTLFVKFEHASYSGFGIHGTWEPESIGTMASRGCIRLSNDDIEDFARLVPSGSEVVITR